MGQKTLTFFNNKGGVGKTSLVYHLSWIISQMDYTVLCVDLDPQANLTSAFLSEEQIIDLWESDSAGVNTIYKSIQPLTKVGDIQNPDLIKINQNLYLLAGDIRLSNFEDYLSDAWPNAMGSADLYRPFRVLSSFWLTAQLAATKINADVILFDVGPNLGAINRSALIASDYIVVPLGADLFSLQGLKNLGPILRRWRTDWKKRIDNWPEKDFEIPLARMEPIGYVVQQHEVRQYRPVKAYRKWVERFPKEYRNSILGLENPQAEITPEVDENLLQQLKHYRSLIPMAQERNKPIFNLTVADGAIGSHAAAVKDARKDFKELAEKILTRMDIPLK